MIVLLCYHSLTNFNIKYFWYLQLPPRRRVPLLYPQGEQLEGLVDLNAADQNQTNQNQPNAADQNQKQNQKQTVTT